jgi:arabinose-5-phosphate isomerase
MTRTRGSGGGRRPTNPPVQGSHRRRGVLEGDPGGAPVLTPPARLRSPRRPPREVAAEVLNVEAEAIRGLLAQLDESFDQAVELLRSCRGRVVCTGMGKSGIIMRKVAATLASTGTPSLFLHPAEAIHGDLGMIVAGDVVLAASYSGTTEELVRLVQIVKRLGVPLVSITANARSPLARHADFHLRAAIDKEACPLNLAPTASTTATLALADALAMAVLEARGFTREDFARLHPGGNLGKRLLRVRELMHVGDEVPQVDEGASMRDAIYEMSRKKLGITAVTRGGNELAGVISDGDLRRMLERDVDLRRLTAGQCMKESPKTIAGDELASAALERMEAHRITSLFVCDDERRLEGVVHLHDLWRLELF